MANPKLGDTVLFNDASGQSMAFVTGVRTDGLSLAVLRDGSHAFFPVKRVQHATTPTSPGWRGLDEEAKQEAKETVQQMTQKPPAPPAPAPLPPAPTPPTKP